MLDVIIDVPTWSIIYSWPPGTGGYPGSRLIPPLAQPWIGVLASDCRCSPFLCSSQALVSVILLLLFELRLNHLSCIICQVVLCVCSFFTGAFSAILLGQR